MLTASIDVPSWTPDKVQLWLQGLWDDDSWMDLIKSKERSINGKELLLMTSYDLMDIGAIKVDLQECIMSAIDKLRIYNFSISRETVQTSVLKLGCLARSLHKQLLAEHDSIQSNVSMNNNSKSVVHSSSRTVESRDGPIENKQRVSLDTLASISNIVTMVRQIIDAMSHSSFSKHNDLRSMKSLILALSIELTSTAQRDQFVEKPNDILERSAKALADYCDRIVQGVTDPLLIQPFYFETVKFKNDSADLGFIIKTLPTDNVHVIDKVVTPPLANKTNRLHRGDEVVQINDQNILGWTAKKVEQLVDRLDEVDDILLTVKKLPRDTNL